MSQPKSVAASLPAVRRKSLAIELLSKTEPIVHPTAQHQVSRKFLYQQGQKAGEAIDEAFSYLSNEQEVLLYLPVTRLQREAERVYS